MKKLTTIKNKTCRMCDGTTFKLVVDLGKHPLVNSLITKAELKDKEPMFPLVVRQCDKCSLVQLTEIVDSHEIYKNVDYLFFSSDMPGLSAYFKEFADDVKKRFIQSKDDLVVEIGCNDGVFLNHFKDNNKILGVDPATNVVLRTLKKGIPAVPLFFNERLAKQIAFEWGQAKVIAGSNCIAHLNDLRDLMRGIKALLRDDGVFILEANYWGGMVKNTNYSLIYHDHYSYFSVKVWEKFAKQFGMQVFDAVVTPAQGGSLRLFLSKDKRKQTTRLETLKKEELRTKLNTNATSVGYRKDIESQSLKLKKLVTDIVKSGGKIAGYGAAAKGFTIIRTSGIGAREISYFVDDSPAKQGLFTPIDHIRIITRAQAEKELPDYFMILAPNYADVILEKEKEFRAKGGKFIICSGDIKVV